MIKRGGRSDSSTAYLPYLLRAISPAHYHKPLLHFVRLHPLASLVLIASSTILLLLLCAYLHTTLSTASFGFLFSVTSPLSGTDPQRTATLDVLYPPSGYDRAVSTFTYPLTITTAYYPFPSKHSSSSYHQWLSNLLSLNPTPIVIYTTAAYYPQMAAIRYRELFVDCGAAHFTLDTANTLHNVACRLQPNRSLSHFPTHFNLAYSSPLDLPITALYSPYWEQQLAIDPERAKHTPTLYATWAAKAYLVNQTATLNPFRSRYFAWLDAGQLRSSEKPWKRAVDGQKLAMTFGESEEGLTERSPFRTFHGSRHPHPSARAVVSRQHKLLVNLVHPLPASYCTPFDPFITFPPTLLSDHTAGQSYLGTAAAIHWYADLYYRLLLSYQSRGVLWGKDQNVANGVTFGYGGSVLLLGAWKVAGRSECVVGQGWDAHWSWMGEWLQQRGEYDGTCPDEMYAVEGMVVEGQAVCEGQHAEWLQQSEEEASKLQGPPAQVARAEAEQTKQRNDSG